MGNLIIEEDLFVKHNIVDPHSPEGRKIHAFLLARAKLLAGKKIDFEKNPVAFVLSDVAAPNAFYAPSPQEHGRPQRDEYENIRYTKNPLDIPVIGVTKGLIDMVDNIDQLDCVLAHELTHRIIRRCGAKGSSKGEELLSDLHAVDLVYDAGADPKQALKIEDKLHEYAKQRETDAARRMGRGRSREKETGINWSEILDVHVTHRNTRTALEASLTRLSHLIDEREPSAIDKSVFAVTYSDPVEDFLKANDYEKQKAVGKLKILIDCIDHLSAKARVDEYYQAKLDALSKQEADIDPADWLASHELERAKAKIQESIDEGHKNYFRGQTIEKKYQQKIAALTEGLFDEIAEERERKHNQLRPAAIYVKDLNVYLLNKAYQHIKENGYPEAGNHNFFDAAGIMYTYFYVLFASHRSYRRGRHNSDEVLPRVLPKIEVDLEDARQQIRSADRVDAFVDAAENFNRLTKIFKDLSSASYGRGSSASKLDNLSFVHSNHHDFSRSEGLYPDIEIGEPVPWNNLVEIARVDARACAHVIDFLKEQGFDDYRITGNQPFVRRSRYSCFGVNKEGIVSERRHQYELDYAIQPTLVLQSYKHIKGYFDNESALFETTCNAVLRLTDADFIKYKTAKNPGDRLLVAHSKIINFVQLYNSLPEENSDSGYRPDSDNVLSLVSGHFLRESPLPCSDEEGRLILDGKLFEFDNPVFQQHFGEDFEERLTARKAMLKQKMFDTAFKVIGAAATMWADVAPKAEELEEKRSALWEQRRSLEGNSPAIEEIELKLKELNKQLKLYKTKEELAENIVLNYTCCVITNESYRYMLNRLTPQQKEVLADYIVRDKNGLFSRLLGAERYTSFCDFKNVLSQQVERVVSGDYALTEMMRTVASNLGYEKANTKEALRSFVDAAHGNRRRLSGYAWYLHVFDSMQNLGKNSEINLRNLAKAMGNIERSPPSTYSDRNDKQAMEVYQNYARLMKDSPLLELVAKAVDFQGNYEGLSVDEMIETVDGLISLRNQAAKLLERKTSQERYDETRGYYNDVKDETDPKHIELLGLFDKNIRNAIRKAERQALQKDDALEKITDLYRLYNANERHSYHSITRGTYLSVISNEEKTLEKISALSKNKDFWPEDILDHIKAYVFAKNTFLDDVVHEDRLLNDILDKLKELPSSEKKKECLSILLDKNLRAPYPETRGRLFTLYSDDVLADFGKDDGSQNYRDKLAKVLDALKDGTEKDWDIGKEHGSHCLLSCSLSSADKYILLRRVSDNILSQEETSALIHNACQINLRSEDLVRSYLYGVGVDYLTAEMDRDPDSAKKFIQFLNSKGQSQDCRDMSAYIEENLSKEERSGALRYGKNEILKNTKPDNCKLLYENFWSAPLEARAVIIARISKCAVNEQSETATKPQQSWERVFDLVMDTVIRPDDTSVESRYARDIMHSYIKSRSDYEREIILSAMMVANRNIGADAGNVGKALKLFLENMGPAEIKLGQAIASHPNTPEKIRKELQELKNMADKPPRWALYEWIRTENIPEELWKDKYLGEILGSASYYTTVALGDHDVLRILRPEAREKAGKGFKVIGDTVADLQEKDVTSDLDYRELTTSVAEMVTQASKMAKIETDHKLGQKQYEYAQEIYNGAEISGGKETFSLRAMDWKAMGKNWIIMQRAKGPIFNDLPEDTPEQRAYKKAFAKAYIVFEIRNILSGRKFDHDKHGAQLCIDKTTNEAGIFDTGAMALRDPSKEEQRQLGHVIYDVMKDAYGSKQDVTSADLFEAFGNTLGSKIEELHRANVDPQYLVEVKKGLLALGDFFKVLDEGDIKELVSDIDIYDHISKHTKAALQEKMSLAERAQLKLFLAGQSLSKSKSVVIKRAQAEVTRNVTAYAVAPNVPDKSDWLQKAFANTNEEASKKGEGVSAKATMRLATVVELKTYQSTKAAQRPALSVSGKRAQRYCWGRYSQK